MRSTHNPWLHRYAVVMTVAVLGLIGMGGLVTSHGVGLSVPDWPTSYGYNMFLFPISMWRGGIFYEHTHRLAASAVGFLTILLAIWLWVKESRARLRWLGVVALGLVILQGVLGGLRVTLLKDELGIVHAVLAQLFLILLASIALMTSRWWIGSEAKAKTYSRLHWTRLPVLACVITALILVQLILGATMRHQHAGLAVPDFPLAYGKVWPPADPQSLREYNQKRVESRGEKPITAMQIHLHMTHRLMAGLIVGLIAYFAWLARRQKAASGMSRKWPWAWLAIVLIQGLLGALTVWSNKAADVTTAHVVLGSLTLLTGAILTLAFRRADFMNHSGFVRNAREGDGRANRSGSAAMMSGRNTGSLHASTILGAPVVP